MAVSYQLDVPLDFGGMQLSAELAKVNPNKAQALSNVRRTASGALTDREGSKVFAADTVGGAYGTFIYSRTDPDNFSEDRQLLVVASSLYKKVDYTLRVQYAGSAQAVVECLADPSTGNWHFKLFEDETQVLDVNLGIGFDESSPVTLGTLQTAINAVTNFSVSPALSVTAAAIPAALLQSTAPTIFSGSPAAASIIASVRTKVNQPTGAADPFAGTHAARAEAGFENVSSFEDSGNIYFCSKYDEQKKYDGNDVYRAGMPEALFTSVVASAGGSNPAGVRSYMITFVQIDQNGLEVEGIESEVRTVTTSGGNLRATLTIPNIQPTSGFNTDGGMVNGVGYTNVNTFPADNGSAGAHSIKVGQNIFFYDGVTGGYIVRKVTAVVGNLITVDGAPVTVTDNTVISNNLRIRIWRTVDTGTIEQHLIDIPNNSFTANTTYVDDALDSTLGEDYGYPALQGLDHGLPPRGAYGTKFNGRPVVCGLVSDGLNSASQYFAWASQQGPEYYPENNLDLISEDGNAPIVGAKASDRYLWIFQGAEAVLVTGDLFTAQYTRTKKGDAAGCISNSSIVSTDTGMVWLGKGSFYRSKDGEAPVRISDDIEATLDIPGLPSDRQLKNKRAVSVWDSTNKLFICFVPAETTNAGEVYANNFSRTFVFDARKTSSGTERGDWYEWNNWNFAGGVVYEEDTGSLYWTERNYSIFDGALDYKSWKRLNSSTIYDQIDHNVAIDWFYLSNWFHANQPKIQKKFPYLAVYSLEPEISAYGTVTVQTFINYVSGATHSEFTQTFGNVGGSGWGYSKWGSFPWGNPANTSVKPRRLRNGNVEAIQTKYSGGAIYSKSILSNSQMLVVSPFKIDMKGVRSGGD